MKLMIVCGEPSGDLLGAQLMVALRALRGDDVTFVGMGGAAMAAQGLDSIAPLEATAVMGIVEIVPAIPKILKLIARVADFAAAEKPDAVIVVDSPEFTQRVARAIRRRDPAIRTVDYVAPQVWAMRPGRAKAMAGYLDLVLALLPFEPPFFEKYGLKAVFVGHPAVERAAKMTGAEAFRARHAIGAAPLLAVLPGSRSGEVKRLLPVFRDAVAAVAAAVPGLVCVLPAADHVAERVRTETAGWPVPPILVEGEAEKFAAFAAADAALAASGTVTTELALANTPTVVAYKVAPLTAAIARRLITVKYATLTNLILDREVMPEFIQDACTPERLAAAAVRFLTEPAAAESVKTDLHAAMTAMGLGGEAPSIRAAKAVLSFLQA